MGRERAALLSKAVEAQPSLRISASAWRLSSLSADGILSMNSSALLALASSLIMLICASAMKWPSGIRDREKINYLNRIPRFLEKAIKHFVNANLDPIDMFENRSYEALEIYFILRGIPGIGPKKACMIARDFVYDSRNIGKIMNPCFYQIKKKHPQFKVTRENLLDMPIDVQVTKVFLRIFGQKYTRRGWRNEILPNVQDLIAFSKLVFPDFPAKLDEIFWNIGRTFCDNRNPKCSECLIRKICEVGKKEENNKNKHA